MLWGLLDSDKSPDPVPSMPEAFSRSSVHNDIQSGMIALSGTRETHYFFSSPQRLSRVVVDVVVVARGQRFIIVPRYGRTCQIRGSEGARRDSCMREASFPVRIRQHGHD